ncbi:hypothetical protein SteCoe_36627 [Stentor coeruleus]|uniref:TLC domain-containing protein n=1 Tax=Stentor coeruleus TaxID=5963 RepID=A0A1R2AQ25_9CILI|nr:hypothetical protein SteCoe_36627 [Stentor coeruleus]
MQIFWITLYSSFAWSFLFILVSNLVYLNIPKRNLWDFRNRIVSFVHGLYCIWFSTTEILHGTPFGAENTEFQEFVLSISLGYFLYDTICMFVLNIYDRSIILHHTLVFSGVISGLATKTGGIEMTFGYFVAECTNPLLQIKESLKTLGQKDTLAFFYMEIIFILGYLLSRIGMGVPVIYYILQSYQVILIERITALSMEIMFCWWAKTMIIILKKRYNDHMTRKEKGIVLPWFVPFKKED